MYPLLVLCCVATLQGQDTVRVATYNILNYPGTDSAIRNPYFRAVLRTMNPDVLIVQEITSQTGVNNFRDNVLNWGQPGVYTSVPFNNGPDTDNAMFYKSSKVVFLGATYIPTSLRDIAEYRFRSSGSSDTVRLYSVHLKGNQEDSLQRLNEATTLRNYLNGLPAGSKFIVGGDFNVYRSTEPGFVKLIGSESNNNGRSKDPLNAVGTWHINYAFREIHTQSPRTRDFGNGTTGGMDDRFDMLLVSYPMDPHLILSSYKAYGNDGNHYNDSINRLPNSAVPDSVANGLHYAADHLPVVADFVFGAAPPGTGFTSIASGSWNSAGIWSGGQVPTGTSAVTIGVGTAVTIDGTVNCQSIEVKGTLQFDGTDGRSLTVGGNLLIESGGTVAASAAFSSGSTTQSLNIAGNMANNGSLNPRVSGSSSGTRTITVIFNGAVPATISGSTNPTNFNVLRMNMSSTAKTLTPLIDIGFTGSTANALTLLRGTWVQSVGQTVTPNVNITVDTNAVFSLSDGGTFITGAASFLVRGALTFAGGTLNVGSGNNRLEALGGSTLIFTGGTANIAGRFTLSGGTTTMNGGSIVINPRGSSNLGATSNVFEAAAAASVTMTGGSVTIVNPRTATSTGREVKIVSGTGPKTFSGGAFVIGDGLSSLAGSDSGFVIESSLPLSDLVLQTGGGTGRDASSISSLMVGNLTLTSGKIQLDTFSPGVDLTVKGSLIRIGGSIVTGSRTVTLSAPAFAPAVTSINGGFVASNSLPNLVVNNPSGVDLGGDIEITSLLSITSGLVRTLANKIILGQNALFSEPGGTAVRGTIVTTRVVSQSTNESFGGLGVEILADSASPGVTMVTRVTGNPITVGYASSISRYFDIDPAVNAGLGARLRLFYDVSETGGQTPTTFRSWKSENSGSTWTAMGGVVNTGLRRVELTAIDALSRWTISDSANPLNLVSVCVPLASGWNLLANPVLTPHDTVRQLFPTSTSACGYRFAGATGYQQQCTIPVGIGVWLKFPGAATQCITGISVTSDSIPVQAGWNMIGSISVPIDTGSIQQIPPGIRTSSYFQYTGTYGAVDSLYPGKSYWVKFSAPGVLVMNAPAASRFGGPGPFEEMQPFHKK